MPLEAGHAGVAVYVLNMGQPVKIVDLAERLIRLSGLEPGRDIDIAFTGIRPGERLQETLFAHDEPTVPIGIEGIVAAEPVSPPLDAMRGWLAALEQGLAREDRSVIFGVLRDAVPDFGGEAASGAFTAWSRANRSRSSQADERRACRQRRQRHDRCCRPRR